MITPDVTLGFVIPWYGETIGGGAEAECRDVVKLLLRQGYDVEVLTTCVKDFRSDWGTNYHKPGVSVEGGVRVRRFLVRERDREAFDRVNLRLMQGETITPEQEDCFFREMVNSDALYEFLDENSSKYLYFFIPYMFSTSRYGAMVCPERSVLIPCLHDESYAYLTAIRNMFTAVREIVFLSPEEEALARRLYRFSPDVGRLIGGPVEHVWRTNPQEFRRKHNLERFLLYAGRTDAGKNADMLVEFFARYVSENATDLKLVFIGGGQPTIPDSVASRVRQLGFLDPQDKYNAFGASVALCVPSVMESFSIVMMESWLAGRPVIVNAECAVTTDLCRRANAGLYFENYDEFAEIVTYLLESTATARQLGAQGREYVKKEYDPDVIAGRYAALIAQLAEAPTV